MTRLQKRLVIHHVADHVFVFGPRSALTGRRASRVTARLIVLLDESCGAYVFLPAHDADVFAWVIEFPSSRSAAGFVRRLVQSHRARPL